LSSDHTEEDFIGVKIGDLNGSAKANFSENNLDEGKAGIELIYEDAYVNPGEQIELTLSNTTTELYGYQFSLDITGLEFIEVKGEGFTQENIGVFNEKITMSYNSEQALEVNAPLFTIVLKAKHEGKVSEMVGMNSHITIAEAYIGKQLDVVSIDLRDSSVAEKVELHQNQPNPFSEYTVIGYELPESGIIKISFHDVTGRLLSVIEKESTRGYNELRIHKSDLGKGGMIYYKLQSKDQTITKHMILIE